MTTIYARATDQVLTGTILPKVACSNRNTVQIHVDFDSTWHGYAKSAVFCTEDDPTVYEVPFSSAGNCTIPAEVLAYAGRLNIYAKGVKSASGAVKSTTPLIVRVLAGTPAVIVSDPSGAAYDSLLEAYSRTAEELAVERARIDNIAKLTSGSTTGDAELADIRVGVDGATYGTAGGAVRTQIANVRQLAYNNFYTRATYLRNVRCDVDTAAKVIRLTRTSADQTVIFSDKRWVSVNSDSSFDYGTAETTVSSGFTAAFVYNSNAQAIVMREMVATNPHGIFETADIILCCLFFDNNRNIVAVPLAEINNFYIDGEIYPEEAIEPEWAIGSNNLRVNVDVANNKLICTKGGNVFFPSTRVQNNAYTVTAHETECEFQYSRTVAVVLDANQTLQVRHTTTGNNPFSKGDLVLGLFHISNVGALNEAFCHKQMEQVFSFNGAAVFADPLAEIEKIKMPGKTTCKIFKRVCCCGDSYTSGHMTGPDGVDRTTNEGFAWPHYMATATGNEWINCGQSGANVLTWQTAERGLAKAQAAGKVQAYVIGLMLNDVASGTARYVALGNAADIGTDAQTYYGGMSAIIRKLNAISPEAKIFVQVPPIEGGLYTTYSQAVKDIVAAYKDTYPVHCLDLLEYREMYAASSLTADRLNGHYTAAGYEQFAEILMTVMSDYMNANISDFQDVAFIEYD